MAVEIASEPGNARQRRRASGRGQWIRLRFPYGFDGAGWGAWVSKGWVDEQHEWEREGGTRAHLDIPLALPSTFERHFPTQPRLHGQLSRPRPLRNGSITKLQHLPSLPPPLRQLAPKPLAFPLSHLIPPTFSHRTREGRSSVQAEDDAIVQSTGLPQEGFECREVGAERGGDGCSLGRVARGGSGSLGEDVGRAEEGSRGFGRVGGHGVENLSCSMLVYRVIARCSRSAASVVSEGGSAAGFGAGGSCRTLQRVRTCCS